MRTMLRCAVAVALMGGLTACEDKGSGGNGGGGDAGGDSNTGGGTVQPGQVSGRVLGTQGQPIAGAAIYLGGAGVSAVPRKGKTDAQGNYVITEMTPRYTYKAFAWVPVTYRGKDFCLRAAPEDASGYEPFLARDGAIRNFRWKLQGKMDDSINAPDEDGYWYGASVRFSPRFEDGDYSGFVELQFTPTAPLVDGSQGQVVTRKVEVRNGFALDIPLGVYKVKATRIMTDGTRVAARIGPSPDEATEETPLEFSPYASGECGSAEKTSGVDRAFLDVVSP